MAHPSTIVIGIGAQASGTTWLAGFLRRHPQAYFPAKELHYFERLEKLGLGGLISAMQKEEGPASERWKRDILERWRFSPDRTGLRRRLQAQKLLRRQKHSAYLEHLMAGAGPQHRIVGEYTPAYATCSEEVLGEIVGLGPDVRLIYIMRDPVEREWSSVKKAVLSRLGRDREAALTEVLDRGNDLPEFETKGVHARTDYAGTLDRLSRVVPRNRLLVLFYEEFFKNQDTTPVTDFLGLDPKAGTFEKNSNPGIGAGLTGESRSRLYARLKDQYTAIESYMGYIPDEWRQTMKEAA